MKKIFKNLESIKKKTIFILLILCASPSIAEVNEKSWSKECDTINGKETCIMIIIKETVNNDRIVTAWIEKRTTTQNKMTLISEEDKTYKLKETKTIVPFLVINLPLNVNIQKKPAIVFEGKKLFELSYTHCNGTEGCSTTIGLNDEVVKIFKAGKEIIIAFGSHGDTQIRSFEIPLKGFSKAYDSLGVN